MRKFIVLMLILCFVAVSAQGDYFTSFEATEGYTDDVTLNGTQGWSLYLGGDRGWTWSAGSHPLHSVHDPGPAAVAGSGSQYARVYGVPEARTILKQDLDATERVGSGKENVWTAKGSSLMYVTHTLSTYTEAYTYFGNIDQGWAAEVGFYGNNFAYYDGGTRVQSAATISIGTWYKYDVTMNCNGTGVTDTYDLIISNAATGAEVLSAQNIEFRSNGAVDYISTILISNGRADVTLPEWYNKSAIFFDDVSLTVPEPATMILLLGGVLGMIIRRKK